MKILTKKTILVLRLFVFFCGALMLFDNTSITVYAHEQNEIHEHDNFEGGLASYSGYGCNNGVGLQVNLSGQTENLLLEQIDGFGHDDSCGGSREGVYSSSYYCGCRNWQVMPIIAPMFKYWIDE